MIRGFLRFAWFGCAGEAAFFKERCEDFIGGSVFLKDCVRFEQERAVEAFCAIYRLVILLFVI